MRTRWNAARHRLLHAAPGASRYHGRPFQHTNVAGEAQKKGWVTLVFVCAYVHVSRRDASRRAGRRGPSPLGLHLDPTARRRPGYSLYRPSALRAACTRAITPSAWWPTALQRGAAAGHTRHRVGRPSLRDRTAGRRLTGHGGAGHTCGHKAQSAPARRTHPQREGPAPARTRRRRAQRARGAGVGLGGAPRVYIRKINVKRIPTRKRCLSLTHTYIRHT